MKLERILQNQGFGSRRQCRQLVELGEVRIGGEVIERNVQSVGRLDLDTTGLLLFSDDGAFIHNLSSPKKHIPKVYRAELAEDGTDALIERLLAGVDLIDEPLPVPALSARLLAERTLEMSIDLGKYHVVKRMVAAAGNHVEKLHRNGFGGLTLGEGPLASLAEGEWIYLEEADLQQLYPAA